MNLSKTQQLILELLAEKRESYGLELVRDSGGKLKRGTIYVLLHRLSEKGLVDSKLESLSEDQKGAPRRIYKVTGSGMRAYQAFQILNLELEEAGLANA